MFHGSKFGHTVPPILRRTLWISSVAMDGLVFIVSALAQQINGASPGTNASLDRRGPGGAPGGGQLVED